MLSMIKACDSRMAGYFLASRRLLRLQRTLENMVVSDEWRDLKFVGKAKIEKIVRGGLFFNQASALQQVLLPMLTTLRLADQTKNAMPAFVFFMRKTACSFAQSQELLNDQEVFPAGSATKKMTTRWTTTKWTMTRWTKIRRRRLSRVKTKSRRTTWRAMRATSRMMMRFTTLRAMRAAIRRMMWLTTRATLKTTRTWAEAEA